MLTDLETSPSAWRQFFVADDTGPTFCTAESARERYAWRFDTWQQAAYLAVAKESDFWLHLVPDEETIDDAAYFPSGLQVARLLHAYAQQGAIAGSDRAWMLAEAVIFSTSFDMDQSLSAARLESTERPWLWTLPPKSLQLALSSTLATAPVCATYGYRAAKIGHACQLNLPVLSVDVVPEMREAPASREQMIEMLEFVPNVLTASGRLNGLIETAIRSLERRLYPGYYMHSEAVITPFIETSGMGIMPDMDITCRPAATSRFNIIDFIRSMLDDADQGSLNVRVKMKSDKDLSGDATGALDNGRPMRQPGTNACFDPTRGSQPLPEEPDSVVSDLSGEFPFQDNPFSRENMYRTLLGKRKGPPAERG